MTGETAPFDDRRAKHTRIAVAGCPMEPRLRRVSRNPRGELRRRQIFLFFCSQPFEKSRFGKMKKRKSKQFCFYFLGFACLQLAFRLRWRPHSTSILGQAQPAHRLANMPPHALARGFAILSFDRFVDGAVLFLVDAPARDGVHAFIRFGDARSDML
jgi:hypothetical protein